MGIVFIPIFVYQFVNTLLDRHPPKYIVSLLYLSAVPSVYLGWSDLIYDGLASYFWGFYPTAGRLYFIFLFLFATIFSYCVFLLFMASVKARHGQQIHKAQQISYVLIASIGATFGVVDYIIKFRIPVYPFGYACGLFFIALIAYAITKTKLMDISVVISRSLAYGVAVGVYILVYAGILFLYRATSAISWIQATGNIIFVILVGLSFYPVRQFLQTASDKAFIKGTYDPLKVMNKLTNKLVGSLTVEDAIASTKEVLKEDVEITTTDFYLIEDFGKREPTGNYICRADGQEKRLGQDDPIVQALKNRKDIISANELPAPETKGAVIILPVLSKDKLIAFLSLGRKYSEESYKSQDLDFLRMIAGQLAIVFERIRPYEQVKDDYQKSLEAAEKADRLAALGTLAMGIAHEIRNPMSALSLQAELLPQKLGDKEFLLRFAEIIPRNIFRLLNITEKMLSFGSPKQEGQASVSVNDLIEDVLVLSESKVKKQKVTVNRELGQVPQITADKNGISQVLINLVFNALDAMAEEGQLTISTRPGEVLQKGGTKVPGVVIEIRDTGKGMSQEVLNNIFTPFFTTRHEGTGLGLSTAARIVYEHNGTIEVASQVGKGTIFTVSLPIAG